MLRRNFLKLVGMVVVCPLVPQPKLRQYRWMGKNPCELRHGVEEYEHCGGIGEIKKQVKRLICKHNAGCVGVYELVGSRWKLVVFWLQENECPSAKHVIFDINRFATNLDEFDC